MSLRQAAQQALEALEWNYNTDLDNIAACEQWAKMLDETITALRAALAEPEQDEVRHLRSELDRKSDAIQRLWKERDELRAVLTKMVGSK